MYARTTLFELDTVRMPLDSAVRVFEEHTLPVIRQQPGYEGVYVLATPEGKGMIVSLWSTEAAAQEGIQSGFYDEQVARFLMLLRQPPGREFYEILISDTRAPAHA